MLRSNFSHAGVYSKKLELGTVINNTIFKHIFVQIPRESFFTFQLLTEMSRFHSGLKCLCKLYTQPHFFLYSQEIFIFHQIQRLERERKTKETSLLSQRYIDQINQEGSFFLIQQAKMNRKIFHLKNARVFNSQSNKFTMLLGF